MTNRVPQCVVFTLLFLAVCPERPGACFAQNQPDMLYRVITFGDSLTAPREGVNTYTDQLQQNFDDAGRGISFHNAGVPGNTTADARRRFEQDVLAREPDLVVIEFGINDSAVDVWKDPPATGPRVPLDEFASNLHYFIDALRTASCRVVLVTPNPICWTPKLRELYHEPPYDPDDPEGMMPPLWPYLEKMRDIAGQHDLPLVDVAAMYLRMPEAESFEFHTLLPDGMHPNTAGHTLVAEALQPIIEQRLPASRVVAPRPDAK